MKHYYFISFMAYRNSRVTAMHRLPFNTADTSRV